MYICICNGITEDQLKSAAGQSGTRREVLKKLGIGESCGTCLLDAMDYLGIHPTQTKNESPSSTKGNPKIPK